MWKAFVTNILKAFYGDALIKVPGGTIGYAHSQAAARPRMRFVRRTPFSWMEGVFFGDLPTVKPWATRINHLISTRSYPTPTQLARAEERDDHRRITRKDVDPFEVDSATIFDISREAYKFGKKLRPKVKSSNAHLSLTNSAELDTPRSQGGRAAAVARDFFQWAKAEPTSRARGETWHGTPFNEEPGRPRFSTMCRPAENFLKNYKRVLESNDDFEIDVIAWLEDPTKFAVKDSITGLDEAVGPQILQWAIDTGIRLGYLSGSRFKDANNPLKRTVKPLPFRYSDVGEPGLKTRPITVAEAWSDLFLSPFGHDFISILDQFDECQAGLHAAYQGYELAKALHGFHITKDMLGMSGDLVKATEYIEDAAAKPMCKSFFRGLGTLDVLREAMIDTLLSAHEEIEYDGEGNQIAHLPTQRAALMGRAGARGTLVLSVIIAKRIALRKSGSYSVRSPTVHVEPHLFRTAGDDFFLLGKRKLLDELLKQLEKMGMRLNRAKFLFSSKGTRFCEEMLVWDHCRRPAQGHISKVPYDEHSHVDSIKIRLLCPVTKDSDGSMGRNDTNPAIGKAFMVAKQLAWFPPGFDAMRETVVERYRQRMRPFIDWKQPMVYLPPALGG
jgi:hypothetical protein